MKEYIEREVVIEMVEKNSTTRFDWSEAVDIEDLIPAIKDIPAADVALVRHGRWKGAGIGDYRCSECWEVYSGGNEFTYCPTCGAKMKED